MFSLNIYILFQLMKTILIVSDWNLVINNNTAKS